MNDTQQNVRAQVDDDGDAYVHDPSRDDSGPLESPAMVRLRDRIGEAVNDYFADSEAESFGAEGFTYSSALELSQMFAAAGRDARARASSDYAVCEESHDRYFVHWLITQSEHDAHTKLLMHAITLHVNARNEPTCIARVETLARHVGLSVATVKSMLAKLEAAGLLDRRWQDTKLKGGRQFGQWGIAVTPAFDAACETAIRQFWRVKPPIGNWGFVDRWSWERETVQRGHELDTTAKAVAMAVSSLCNKFGVPRTTITCAKLAKLAGYEDLKTVQRGLRTLELQQYIIIKRKRGRNGGMLIGLALPLPALDAVGPQPDDDWSNRADRGMRFDWALNALRNGSYAPRPEQEELRSLLAALTDQQWRGICANMCENPTYLDHWPTWMELIHSAIASNWNPAAEVLPHFTLERIGDKLDDLVNREDGPWADALAGDWDGVLEALAPIVQGSTSARVVDAEWSNAPLRRTEAPAEPHEVPKALQIAPGEQPACIGRFDPAVHPCDHPCPARVACQLVVIGAKPGSLNRGFSGSK